MIELRRDTLADQVAEGLMAFISTTLEPGDQLPSAAALAEQFSVSRSVIREALQSLASQRVIEVRNGKGAFVRPVDATLLNLFFDRVVQTQVASIPELMEVRRPLEMQSARLAALRRTDKERKRLKKQLKAMRENLHDLEAYTELDVHFHLLIARASHNEMMDYLIGSIRESLHVAIGEGLRRRDTLAEIERVQEIHEIIYECIANSDEDQAEVAMARHFDEAVSVLVAHAG